MEKIRINSRDFYYKINENFKIRCSYGRILYFIDGSSTINKNRITKEQFKVELELRKTSIWQAVNG